MSTVTRRDPVEAEIMEPLYEGGFRPATVNKSSWRCDGCGLVWPMKHQAQACEGRGHKSSYEQEYVYGPIVNGVPARRNSYPRYALRKEAVQ